MRIGEEVTVVPPLARSPPLTPCVTSPTMPVHGWKQSEPVPGIGTVASFHDHRRFTAEGDEAEYVYRILEGVAEGYGISAEGRRQIIRFYAPGEFLGTEAGTHYTMSVDAISSGRVQAFKRTLVHQILTSASPALPELWLGLTREAELHRQHITRLGLPATERVAAFLLDMCDRLSGRDDCQLPMARQAIGDHLGLTIETVSRTLTSLRQMGLIAVSGWRNIAILDRQRLRRFTL